VTKQIVCWIKLLKRWKINDEGEESVTPTPHLFLKPRQENHMSEQARILHKAVEIDPSNDYAVGLATQNLQK
jgi:hypothetical protein